MHGVDETPPSPLSRVVLWIYVSSYIAVAVQLNCMVRSVVMKVLGCERSELLGPPPSQAVIFSLPFQGVAFLLSSINMIID